MPSLFSSALCIALPRLIRNGQTYLKQSAQAQASGLELIGDFNTELKFRTNNKCLNLIQLFDLTQLISHLYVLHSLLLQSLIMCTQVTPTHYREFCTTLCDQ